MEYIGIDIGGTAVKLGIVDEKGDVTISDSYSVCFDHYETPILDTVVKSLELFLKKYSVQLDNIKGIGVSATGQVDIHNGTIAGTAGHIKNWLESRIKETLEECYHLPVTVINDANCAALAEKWIGAAKDVSDAIVITIGTGVGGGIILNSELLTGADGFAGELGHFSIARSGKPCTCGNIGCYEQYASTTALVRMVTEAISSGLVSKDIFPDKTVNGKTIFEHLREYNPGLQSIVDEWLDYVADGLISLVHILNPQMIVIGGGVSAQEILFIEPVRKKVLSRVMPAFGRNLKICAAKLGNHAGMVGAVYYHITHAK